MRYIRAIKSKTRQDRIRNEKLRSITKDSLRYNMDKTRLRWFGYVKRMEEDRITRKMEKLVVNGSRQRRRRDNEVKWDVEARGI